jgi:hypothetical protein
METRCRELRSRRLIAVNADVACGPKGCAGGWPRPLRSLQKKLDLDGFIRKLDLTGFVSRKHASPKQCGKVAVNRLDIPADPMSSLSHGQGAGATHGLEKFPAFGCQYLP